VPIEHCLPHCAYHRPSAAHGKEAICAAPLHSQHSAFPHAWPLASSCLPDRHSRAHAAPRESLAHAAVYVYCTLALNSGCFDSACRAPTHLSLLTSCPEHASLPKSPGSRSFEPERPSQGAQEACSTEAGRLGCMHVLRKQHTLEGPRSPVRSVPLSAAGMQTPLPPARFRAGTARCLCSGSDSHAATEAREYANTHLNATTLLIAPFCIQYHLEQKHPPTAWVSASVVHRQQLAQRQSHGR